MHIIFGNYGDNTLALIQWAHLQQLQDCYVVHVDTGWQAPSWNVLMQKGQALAKKYGFEVVALKPPKNFIELVRDRQQFPATKFQWCVTFLKALPFITWLDEIDPKGEAVIVLGSRRADSRARVKLTEYIAESEYYGERKVWLPLVALSNEERDELIRQAGLQPLHGRSKECAICIHNSVRDFKQLDETLIKTLADLEAEIGQTMFETAIQTKSDSAYYANKSYLANLESFDMGCGSRYVCGE